MIAWEQRVSRLLDRLGLDSVKSRIMAFTVVATLIPALTTGWLSYVENKRSLDEKIAEELRGVSSQAAREVDLWLKERLYDLRVFASSYEVSENLEAVARRRGQSVQRLTDYLSSVQDRFPDYAELLVLGPGEDAVATSAPQPGLVRLAPDWMAELRTSEAVLGVPFLAADSATAFMSMAVPINATTGTASFLGALTARVSFRSIDELLRGSLPGDSGSMILVDDAGMLVASSTGTDPLRRPVFGSELFRRLRRADGRAVDYTAFDGTPVVGALANVPRLEWGVVAQIPQAEAYAQITRLRNVTALTVLGLFLVVGLLAYALAHLIVRSLDRLSQGAARVATGDLNVDIPVTGGRELAYLTSVFNDMVSRLKLSRQELERLSVTDSLTGLYNRRHLLETLDRELRRSHRHDHAFAIMMIDVDHFKQFNDTYGHQAGDDVLIRVGAVLSGAIREVDYAARYGGEEFLVLMPETEAAVAVDAAERIRERMQEEAFAVHGERPSVTLTIGVAEFPADGDTPDAVIASADNALYAAKKAGRNRVTRSSDAQTQRRPSRRASRTSNESEGGPAPSTGG